MPIITLINDSTQVECSSPVYYAKQGRHASQNLLPSHLVAWPAGGGGLDEICYVLLEQGRLPVLVTSQPDGSVWIGGAYLDSIAAELRLIPRPLPQEMEEKTEAWLKTVGDRWQIPCEEK